MAELMYKLLLCVSVLLCMILSSSAQTCSSHVFSSNQVFRSCNDLPFLNSFLHYNHDSSSGKLQIAYRHTGITSRRWVAWAINPKSGGMVGSQALVAFQKTDGSVTVYESPIDSYQTSLKNGSLSFSVSDLSATFENNEITIFATLSLDNKTETLNQVWQDGSLQGDAPQMHDTSGDNVKSMSSLNLVSGESGSVGGNSRIKKRNIHGVLNVVSWGIMMPIGAIIARYLKVFKSADPAWFYLHIFCQSSAYIIGVSGWATGLKLGSESSGIQYDPHRAIGITLFCLGTLQVFALLLRPKPDHKYRFYWNIYHHSIGYLVITLSIVNIFKGFDILNPEKKWKTAYIAVIVVLAIIAVLLEAYTWFVVMKRRKSGNEAAKPSHAGNGTNGVNGYGNRQQHDV